MYGTGAKPKKPKKGDWHSQGQEQRRGGVNQHGSSMNTETERRRTKRKKLSSSGRSDPVMSDNEVPMSREQFNELSNNDKLYTMVEVLAEVRNLAKRQDKFESKLYRVANKTVQNTNRIKTLEYHSIDIEARNRRLNLIFRGIPEVYLEENCPQLIRNFLKNDLELRSADDMPIQRAHRLGAPVRGTQPKKHRPIIVCFMNDSDVQLILSNAYKLSGQQDKGINRDYPQEIIQARSKLWPSYKELKGKYPRKVHIGYPAKLILNGKVVHDEFPDWRAVLNKSRCHPQQKQADGDNETFVSKNPFNVLLNDDSETNDDSDMVVSSDDDLTEKPDTDDGEPEDKPEDDYSQTLFDQENPQRRRANVPLTLPPLNVSDVNVDGPGQNGDKGVAQGNGNSTGDTRGANGLSTDHER